MVQYQQKELCYGEKKTYQESVLLASSWSYWCSHAVVLYEVMTPHDGDVTFRRDVSCSLLTNRA